jgi:UDP-glucose:(glucosyl)LPS beta-1,3-glucosyltransferase
MSRPLVSVITPAYHAAKFIRRALDSVTRQKLLGKIEVIVVIDDCNFDLTPQIAEEYQGRLDITILKNLLKTSPAFARNFAITRMAHGRYIAFLDADDEWLPKHLLNAIAYLTQNPDTDLYYAMCVNCTDEPVGFHGHPIENIDDFCPVPFSTIVCKNPPAFPFDERLRAADDYLWLLKTYRSGAKIHFNDKLESYYYMHGENLTSCAPDWPVQHFMVRLLAGDYRRAITLLPAAIRAKCLGKNTKRSLP